MDSISIELPGSKIKSVTVSEDNEVCIRLEPAYLIKTMTGSKERTKWWQNMDLVFRQATLLPDQALPVPGTCAGGDVVENVYTYRDMIPVPLESRGQVGCDLKIDGSEQHIRVEGAEVELIEEGHPKYIEHLRQA